MNSVILFAIGMAIATFFAALMLHQAYSGKSLLGSDRIQSARKVGWLLPVGSALLVAVSFIVFLT